MPRPKQIISSTLQQFNASMASFRTFSEKHLVVTKKSSTFALNMTLIASEHITMDCNARFFAFLKNTRNSLNISHLPPPHIGKNS